MKNEKNWKKIDGNRINKILLIQPSFNSLATLKYVIDGKEQRDFSRAKYTFPIGLLHIASLLEKNGYDVIILDLDKVFHSFLHSKAQIKDMEVFFEKHLVHFVAECRPDIVGISGNFNYNKSFVTECCKKLKNFDDELPIVLGGHYPTNCYVEIFENDCYVDYVILGEGEEVMLQLIMALSNRDDNYIEKHPNIVVKSNFTSASFNKRAAIIDDLGALPPVNYEILDTAEEYISNSGNLRTIFTRGVKNRAVAIMTTRGCPNQCIYCASHKVHGKKIRAFSIDRIISDLDNLVEKYDINAIIIEDDLFNFSRKRTIELSKNIYDRFGDRFFIEFSNGIAVKTLDEDCIYWLMKAGMKQIHLAIESGNQYVQDEVIKKRVRLEKVKPVVDLLKKYDVIIRAFFIMGFPGESIEMMRDTKRFAKEIEVDWSIFSFASPVAGSELYESAKAKNQLISANSDATTYFDAQLNCDEWTHEDVKEIQEEANYEVNFLDNYNLKKGDYEKSTAIFSDICKSYPKHLIAHYCLWKSQVGIGDLSKAKETKNKLIDILTSDDANTEVLKKYQLLNAEPFNNIAII